MDLDSIHQEMEDSNRDEQEKLLNNNVKITMNAEEARNLRFHITSLLQLQSQQSEINGDSSSNSTCSKDKYDADSIYDSVCLDPRFSQIATIERVKLICKGRGSE